MSRVLPIALKLNDKEVLVMIYNTLGLYSIYYRANYNEAVDYFMKALKFTDTAGGGRDNYVRVINNLAHIHNLRSDTAGLRYSLEVYRAGHRFGMDYWTYIGAINTATQYCVRKEFDEALAYIQEAEALTGKFHSTVEVYMSMRMHWPVWVDDGKRRIIIVREFRCLRGWRPRSVAVCAGVMGTF